MSARAAWRLERLGFARVYRFVGGKANWLAFGLPSEGTDADVPRAADVVRRDVPTCGPHERLGPVQKRANAQGWNDCLVVNEARVVLGCLRFDRLNAAPETTAEQAMEPGPTTIRPNEPLAKLASHLREKQVERSVVTTPDGRLVGVVERRDAETRLAAESDRTRGNDAQG